MERHTIIGIDSPLKESKIMLYDEGELNTGTQVDSNMLVSSYSDLSILLEALCSLKKY